MNAHTRNLNSLVLYDRAQELLRSTLSETTQQVWRTDLVDAVTSALMKDEMQYDCRSPFLDAVHAVLRGTRRGIVQVPEHAAGRHFWEM